MIFVELVGIQVDPLSGAAALVLREHDAPNRLLPIVVGQADARMCSCQQPVLDRFNSIRCA